MSSTGLYADCPLNALRREIRVLHVYPGEWADPLRCSLVVSPLEESTYSCLSYAWHGQAPEMQITVNDSSFKVAPTVYAALRRFRADPLRPSTQEPFRIWIDSICINQEDSNEKGHQVAMMGAIYARAEAVCVWIGDIPSDWTEPVINELEHFYGDGSSTTELTLTDALWYWLIDDSTRLYPQESFKILLDRPLNEINSIASQSMRSEASESFGEFLRLIKAVLAEKVDVTTEVLGIDLDDLQSTRPIYTNIPMKWRRAILMVTWIVTRPWWTRLWTIQEVVLSSSPAMLYFGSFQIPFPYFIMVMVQIIHAFLNIVHRLQKDMGFWVMHRMMSKSNGCQIITLLISQYHSGERASFEEVIAIARSYEATNSRDYLYGILGLVPEDQSKLIRVDYSPQRTTSEIFANATRALIRYHKDLTHLYYANGTNIPRALHRELKEEENVPSWAVNWSHGRSRDVEPEPCGRTMTQSCIETILQTSQLDDWTEVLTIRAAFIGQQIRATSTSVWPEIREHYDDVAGCVRKYVEDALEISSQLAEIDFPEDCRFQKALFPRQFHYVESDSESLIADSQLIAEWCCWIISYQNDNDEDNHSSRNTNAAYDNITKLVWDNMVGFSNRTRACFFVTSHGKLGHAKFQVEDGDELFALPNIHHAAVLRPCSSDGPEQSEAVKQYTFQGFCCLEDFDMHELIECQESSGVCDQEKNAREMTAAHNYTELKQIEVV